MVQQPLLPHQLLWEGGTLCIRDIHMFDQRMESDYYRKAGTTNQCVYTTLPVVDGCMWSTREQLAGAIARRQLFPCFFGSALKLEGYGTSGGLARYAPTPVWPAEFGARIYKVSRDAQAPG